MKRHLMTLILSTIALVGIMHSGHTLSEGVEEIMMSHKNINCYPEPMPNVVFDPMTSIPF